MKINLIEKMTSLYEIKDQSYDVEQKLKNTIKDALKEYTFFSGLKDVSFYPSKIYLNFDNNTTVDMAMTEILLEDLGGARFEVYHLDENTLQVAIILDEVEEMEKENE